jgi:hypothetical protein
MIRFRAPVRRDGDRYVVTLSAEEAGLLERLLGELRELLTSDDEGDEQADALTARLFPVVHPDDPEQEAEYQRLMRRELIESRLEALDVVIARVDSGQPFDEADMTAFMQSVNAVRLVLGTMLGLTDDTGAEADDDEVVDGLQDSGEYHLYTYLSWLLEWSVRALSGR